MTEAFDRTLHRVAEPRWFEDLAVGANVMNAEIRRYEFAVP